MYNISNRYFDAVTNYDFWGGFQKPVSHFVVIFTLAKKESRRVHTLRETYNTNYY